MLTPMQARVAELVGTGQATPHQAAAIAGYAHPAVEGCRVVLKPDVAAEIARIKAARAAKFAELADAAISQALATIDRADANQASLIASRSIETAQLLSGQPTSIAATVNVNTTAAELAARYGKTVEEVLADLGGM